MIQQLPHAPRPYQDELLSSWIARLASVYGMRSSDFLNYLGWQGTDIDYQPSDADLLSLSQATKLSSARIRKLTLASRFPKRSKADFFEPNFSSHHPLVYCSECFIEDIANGRQPYWRYPWASIWRVQCLHHGGLFTDGCVEMGCYLGYFSDQYGPLETCKPCMHDWKTLTYLSKQIKSPRDEAASRRLLEPILYQFENTMENALDGIPPDEQWWLAGDAALFTRVTRDLLPFMFMRIVDSMHYAVNPAQDILGYCDVHFTYTRKKGIADYDKEAVYYMSEQKRLIAMLALSRLMLKPYLEYQSVRQYILNFKSDGVLRTFVMSLDDAAMHLFDDISSQWPIKARTRVEPVLNKYRRRDTWQ